MKIFSGIYITNVSLSISCKFSNMKNRVIFITILSVLHYIYLFAQEPPFAFQTQALHLLDMQKTIPPPPTAAQLGRYGECPVSLYTGRPEINIPLYTIELGNYILPVSLNYNASGIKVTDVASWVGLGWSLNAGGLITRTIRGVRDEIVYNGYTSEAGQILYHQLLDGCQYSDPDYTELISLMNISEGVMDGQPDEYYYNFGNYSGTFIFDKDKTIRKIPNNKQMLISCERVGENHNGKSDSIKKFTIITEDGVQYIFGNESKDKTFHEAIGIYANSIIEYESMQSLTIFLKNNLLFI